jgi:hypothetical protein
MKKLLIVSMIFLFGCASIIHGTRQNVAINSTPSGVKVTKQGVHIGTTPAVVELKRGNKHIVLRFEKDGYEPIEIAMTNKVSGWIVGNILFGGIIGLVIDFITGGAYNLTPEEINAIMQKEGITLNDDSVLVVDAEYLEGYTRK